MMVASTIHLAAETRSFERAAVTMKHVLGHSLSAKTIERLTHQVGDELAERLEASTLDKEVILPDVAVVSCDGGRIRTRTANSKPGVHAPAWRETKNALFERMSTPQAFDQDPCPLLPETFRKVGHVAQIAEMAAFTGIPEDSSSRQLPRYEGPERILRTCLASMACSKKFGFQMEREAKRRRFPEARLRVFLGDGQAWNWSIWQTHFPSFIPILDLIHPIQYLYSAADAWEPNDAARWARYLRFADDVWQGRVDDVINQLESELRTRGVDADPPEDHPLRSLADAARYLRNNRTRMDYPSYRCQGLPITSSPMESLIKQINHRVKGTEMFWNDPCGAEAILQVRAACLSDDGRLADYLARRPGCPFTRRPAATTAA